MREFATDTYDAIAPYYDAFTDHPGYGDWVRRLADIAASHGSRVELVLDVACGTGKSFIPLLDRARQIVACDVSAGMLEVAREKMRGAVALHQIDMRNLSRLGAFDLVSCLNDSLNYLTEPAHLEDALAGMRANVADDGVVMFDLNSRHGHEAFFGGCHERRSHGGTIRWVGRGTRRTQGAWFAEGQLEFRRDGSDGTTASTVHLQRHYPRRVVSATLRRAGLSVAGLYGLGADGSIDSRFSESRHIKALYIARPLKTSQERR